MLIDYLQTRIDDYGPKDAIEQECVLQEILQQYVLMSLSKTAFFRKAMFHGGTCLRLLHQLPRFSEDLDFLLMKKDERFDWPRYLNDVQEDCALEGIDFEIRDRSKADLAVKKAFLKTDSVGKIFTLTLPHYREASRKTRIKLEIDTNPPGGSDYEPRFLTFPRPATIACQSLESGFATNIHALLCRSYVKGRDWYDLIWYVNRGISPKLDVLSNALDQQRPWQGEQPEVTMDWLVEHMKEKVKDIDWEGARNDVKRFLPSPEAEGLAQWGTPFFLSVVERIA